MYDERVLSPEYLALSVDELEAKHAEFVAGAKALLPAVIEKDRLETEAWRVEEILGIRHIEAGTATPSEVKNTMRSGYVPAAHEAVKLWLSQVSTSDRLSVIGLEDWAWGSSDYLLVPFRVDLDNGVDDALVESVEQVLAFLLPVFNDSAGIPIRVNDERIYLTTHISREGGDIRVSVGDYHYSVDHDRHIWTVREALERAAESLPIVRAKRVKDWAEEDKRIAKSNAAYRARHPIEGDAGVKGKRKGLLGLFSR